MAKAPKAERVRKLNAQMARIATAVVRIDRNVEGYMDRKATELEDFAGQLDLITEPEPEASTAN